MKWLGGVMVSTVFFNLFVKQNPL